MRRRADPRELLKASPAQSIMSGCRGYRILFTLWHNPCWLQSSHLSWTTAAHRCFPFSRMCGLRNFFFLFYKQDLKQFSAIAAVEISSRRSQKAVLKTFSQKSFQLLRLHRERSKCCEERELQTAFNCDKKQGAACVCYVRCLAIFALIRSRLT